MIEVAVTEAQMASVRAIREAVFIREQGIAPDEEWDDLDAVARHLLMSDAEGPLGTLRWREKDGEAKIERVCVLARGRGTGAGVALMEAAMAEARRAGLRSAILGAQVRAMGFYARLGFEGFGADYDDAGIPHRMMRVDL